MIQAKAKIPAVLLPCILVLLPLLTVHADQSGQGQSPGGVQWSPLPAPAAPPSVPAVTPGTAESHSPAQAQTQGEPPIPASSGTPNQIPAQRRPSSSERVAQAGTPAPGSKPQIVQPDQVIFNFDDADIYSVIQTIFGEALKVNYVIDSRVKGRVTFRSAAPIPREKVLTLMEGILRLNGIGVVEQAGLYRIVPMTEVSKEPLPVSLGRNPEEITVTGKVRLQVIPINHVSSSEFITMITPFLPANAVIMDIPKNNQVALVDTDSNVKSMLELVEVFDREQTNKRMPEMFVHPLHYSRAKDVAAMLQQVMSGTKPSTPGPQPASKNQPPQAPAPVNPQPGTGGGISVSDATKIYPDEGLNSLVVVATPEEYATIRKMIDKLDIPKRQVSVEGVIAEVTLTDNTSLGMAWQTTISKAGRNGVIAQNPGDLQGIEPTNLSSSGLTLVGLDKSGAVKALVTALAAVSMAKVLAAPHVLVSDGKEARIQVGSQVPIVTSTTIAAAGVPAQQTIQYQDTGVILKVKPSVTETGLVSLDLTQEISTYHTETLFDNEQEIIIDKTQASTNMEVQDGQTIVIAGMIRQDLTKSLTGIPLLSKIPILGLLFGDTSTQKSRNEIIILLTPHVIKNAQDAKNVTSDDVDKFTDANEGNIKKEELLKDKEE